MDYDFSDPVSRAEYDRRHNGHELTEEQVIYIYTANKTRDEIAKQFDIAPTLATAIRNKTARLDIRRPVNHPIRGWVWFDRPHANFGIPGYKD